MSSSSRHDSSLARSTHHDHAHRVHCAATNDTCLLAQAAYHYAQCRRCIKQS
jgi:hypothetical protein